MNKIGIIGAMELEVAQLKLKMQEKQVIERAGMKFHEGVLNGKEVVIVQCGIGKVNAGICVQILADIFQVNAWLECRGLGYEPGIIPQMETSFFPADRTLVDAAKAVCAEVNSDIAVYEGRVVSGDQFISDGAVKDRLTATFDGYCAEMEGAAVAHAAFLNKIPYVVIRAISDKADGSAHMDYPEFERAAAAHSAKLVENLVIRV